MHAQRLYAPVVPIQRTSETGGMLSGWSYRNYVNTPLFYYPANSVMKSGVIRSDIELLQAVEWLKNI